MAVEQVAAGGPGGGAVGALAGMGLLVLFSFSFSWLWTYLAMLLRSEKSVMGVSMMLIFPLSFLSNILVDPGTMPGWLQGFVDVNPVARVVAAVRGLMDGAPVAGDVGCRRSHPPGV